MASVIVRNALAVDQLLARLEVVRTVDGTGSVSFTGFQFDDLTAVLGSFITISDQIPNDDRESYIRRSLLTHAKSTHLTRAGLVREISRRASAYLREPLSRYALFTSLSIAPGTPPFETTIGDVRLLVNIPRRRFSRRTVAEDISRLYPQHPRYAQIIAFVSARSPNGAFECAMNGIDLLRGIWNLALQSMNFRRSFGGPFAPVNAIRSGPVFTLHLPRGQLATETFWYDQSGRQPAPPSTLGKSFERCRTLQTQVCTARRRHPYVTTIDEALRRYARALDGWAPAAVLIELWSLLEFLTGTLHMRYDDTIDRAAFLWRERDFHKVVLEHLRDWRNRVVHAAVGANDAETLVYQAKRYVELLLLFHIFSGHRFAGFAEACQLLSHPTRPEDLEQRLRSLREAIRIRRSHHTRESGGRPTSPNAS